MIKSSEKDRFHFIYYNPKIKMYIIHLVLQIGATRETGIGKCVNDAADHLADHLA